MRLCASPFAFEIADTFLSEGCVYFGCYRSAGWHLKIFFCVPEDDAIAQVFDFFLPGLVLKAELRSAQKKLGSVGLALGALGGAHDLTGRSTSGILSEIHEWTSK